MDVLLILLLDIDDSKRNGHHFAVDTFKLIFLNENRLFILISPKFISERPIDNKTASVEVMAWRNKRQAIT